MKQEYVDSKSIGSDLCSLARLLVQYGICIDTSSLENAGQSCLHLQEDTAWRYELNKISFRINEVGGIIPIGAYDLSASLSLTIIGGSANGDQEIWDPLEKLVFDLELEGFRDNIGHDNLDELYSSWHLDRHIFKVGDGKGKYSHPMYHFTFGGNKMEEKGDIFGDCLILPSPRISYPPMDAALGIDFVLQNFLHRDRIAEIVADPDYRAIVYRAQQRVMKPYFLSLASYWNNEVFDGIQEYYLIPQEHFLPQALFPLFY